jgi:hypothetical protein
VRSPSTSPDILDLPDWYLDDIGVDYPKENYRTFSFIFPDRTVVFYASRLHLAAPNSDPSHREIYEVNKIILNGKELKLPTAKRPILSGTADCLTHL